MPVFLYGILAHGRTRAELRRGGPASLAARIERGELAPDFGPRRLHRTAGAVLVSARPPLVAFNVELAPPATVDDAKAIAARIREGGAGGAARRPRDRPVARAARRRAGLDEHRGSSAPRRWPTSSPRSRARAPVAEAELVGLAPRAAFDGFPATSAVRNKRLIEDALEARARDH